MMRWRLLKPPLDRPEPFRPDPYNPSIWMLGTCVAVCAVIVIVWAVQQVFHYFT